MTSGRKYYIILIKTLFWTLIEVRPASIVETTVYLVVYYLSYCFNNARVGLDSSLFFGLNIQKVVESIQEVVVIWIAAMNMKWSAGTNVRFESTSVPVLTVLLVFVCSANLMSDSMSDIRSEEQRWSACHPTITPMLATVDNPESIHTSIHISIHYNRLNVLKTNKNLSFHEISSQFKHTYQHLINLRHI